MALLDFFNNTKRIESQVQKQMNEFFQLQYGKNQYGTYDQIGNPDTPLESGFNVNTTIYSIVSRIYNAAAKIPLIVQKWDGENWEKVENHPTLDLIECPNKMHGQYEFMQHVYGFRLLTGNSYIYGLKKNPDQEDSEILELHFMPSNHVEIKAGEWFDPIKGYQLSDQYSGTYLERHKVLHLRYPNFDFDHGQEFYGLSPLQVAVNKLKRDKARDELQTSNYENAGAQGLIYDKSQGEHARVMRDDQLDRVQRSLNNRIKNSKNKVAVIGAELGYIPLGLKNSEMQLIEDAKWSLKDFCNLYQVPSVLFNDSDNSKFNNVREAKASLYLNAAIPEVESFCNEFTRQWMNTEGERVWYDTSAIEELQKDRKEMVEWMDKAHYMRPNEKREKLGLDIDTELEELGFLYPTSFMPLAQLEARNILNDFGDEEL